MISIYDEGKASSHLTDEFVRQQCEEFSEATNARLKILDRDLVRLDHQISDADDRTRCRWVTTRMDLIRQRNLAWQSLSRLNNSNDETWPVLAHEIDNARQDLATAIAVARSQLQIIR